MSSYNVDGRLYSSFMFTSTPSFPFNFSFELSMVDRMELRVPVAKEKDMTPMTMRIRQIICSVVVPPDMSPKPTVVIVVIVKYNDTTYN